LRTSIIIPTYNRPDDLKRCIETILIQTVRPDELIIVDDGDLPNEKEGLPLKKECEDAGIKYIYFKKDRPGLTASRNAGIRSARGDIIFFLDDDTALFPDYIERILKVYKEDVEGRIGGVGGAIANNKPLSRKQRVKRIFEIVFLTSGLKEGSVLPSGFCTNFGDTGRPLTVNTEVDFLSGGVSSFRKEIFNEFLFDEIKFQKYGLGEDKDFTYRVSRKYKLIFNPDARLLHLHSPQMRPDHFKDGWMHVNYAYIFFNSHIKKGFLSMLFFYYALFGYVLSRIITLLLSPKKGNLLFLKGVLRGVAEIISKREEAVVK
jgi:glycosyltransferase involved in cell wall biosynthesis